MSARLNVRGFVIRWLALAAIVAWSPPVLAFRPCPTGSRPSMLVPLTLIVLGLCVGLGAGFYAAYRAFRANSAGGAVRWGASAIGALVVGAALIIGGVFAMATAKCVTRRLNSETVVTACLGRQSAAMQLDLYLALADSERLACRTTAAGTDPQRRTLRRHAPRGVGTRSRGYLPRRVGRRSTASILHLDPHQVHAPARQRPLPQETVKTLLGCPPRFFHRMAKVWQRGRLRKLLGT